MSDPALVVMAAGIGSRYGGLKQIEPYGPHGEIILDYSIYDASQSGFTKTVFVINREIEQAFRERIDQTIGQHCETVYVYQDLDNLPEGFQIPSTRKKPWGTAQAVLSCKDVIDTPFAVINADDFYGRSAYNSLADYLRQAKTTDAIYDFCMVGYQLENTLTEHGYVSRGICSVDQQGQLIEVHEKTHIQKFNGNIKYRQDDEEWIEIPKDSAVSMNFWGFTPNLFPELQEQFARFLVQNHSNQAAAEFFLPEVVNDLLKRHRATVKVLPTSERWFGVTYREDAAAVKHALRKMVAEGVYPKNLWGGSNETRF